MDASAIIAALGGDATVAAATGAVPNTVVHWRKRGSIPARWWRSLAALPQSKQAGVTLDVLVQHQATKALHRTPTHPARVQA